MIDLQAELARARTAARLAVGDDTVVLDGPANLLRGWQSIGGWLALTPEWLAFAPHRVNWKPGRVLVPVGHVTRVRGSWSRLLGLFPVLPNGVAVRTASGREYRFVVQRRQEWVGALRILTT